MELKQGELVLCEFYFSDLQEIKLRPVIVFKDNLPFDDFVGIPVSSKIGVLHEDESLIEQADFLSGSLPKSSKAMVRKTFVISKQVVIKSYGELNQKRFQQLQLDFCHYFGCDCLAKTAG
ncbi:type II toxin-antitoxin system PemK/MazF family toxin [Alkalimonas sp. MEB108]|uniref:Type II toxin-antitoxin system PemK/MazF family toxin n=1 Tax=Alkalimonas cellulosilytica TaxID=3058395 RepID=A0ABU7J4R1_9GAMM|nr:type II toxin-antitoxin system PemK/MazF family toxin [Alkalimonas sp. MEB108]MEE2001493.1 type II toxin-antitoxin system PemK/MazF family toxin [Alkalimonas sp. MEB108]